MHEFQKNSLEIKDKAWNIVIKRSLSRYQPTNCWLAFFLWMISWSINGRRWYRLHFAIRVSCLLKLCIKPMRYIYHPQRNCYFAVTLTLCCCPCELTLTIVVNSGPVILHILVILYLSFRREQKESSPPQPRILDRWDQPRCRCRIA